MEENRNMEILENEEIITDLEVYDNEQEIITEPEESEETDGLKASDFLIAMAVGAAIGGAAMGIRTLFKAHKDRKIKKDKERFDAEIKDRLTANGFSDEEVDNIIKNVLTKDDKPDEEEK